MKHLVFLINVDWFFASHFLYLARRARAEGFEVALATHVGQLRERMEREGIIVIGLPARRSGMRPTGLMAASRVVAAELAKRPGAILHGFGLFGILVGSLATWRAARQGRVFTVTGRGYAAIAQSLGARAMRLATRLMCRYLADGPRTRWLAENDTDIGACGLATARDQGRTLLVGGAGVDPVRFAATPMPPRGPLRCALVARAVWSKGLDLAADAVTLARGRGIDVELTIAGTPDPDNPRSLTEDDLRALAGRPGIRWLGRVDDVAGLWREHHIGLLPSRGGEGVPKSLIEAACCGRPILTTAVPGCREFGFATRGWVVAPNDVQALAAALAEIAVAEGLAERGEAARSAVIETYSEDANWRAISRLYEELADWRAASAVPGVANKPSRE